MRVRAYRPEDAAALREIYESQGGELGYELDELASPVWFSKLVLEDENGQVVMATLAKLSCEVHVLVDPRAGTAQERWRNFIGLHHLTEKIVRAKGADDAFCVLARTPRLNRFARRLMALGWKPVRAFWFEGKD
jgi:hypothetical protein